MLAGVNGAGKSSIGGAFLRARPGGDYFNPDERARQILTVDPSLSQAEANSRAWYEGVAALEQAILKRENFSFETTLGGSQTILRLLEQAADEGLDLSIWVCRSRQSRAPHRAAYEGAFRRAVTTFLKSWFASATARAIRT